jgi:UDP-4-amino-4,6-dideoxy-N-acetyl-beta-L-altrosamine transaminase
MMMNSIPYGRQLITPDDIRAVTRVLQSDYLTQGPEIQKFEEAFAAYVGSRFAVAVSNGTAALHLCALALNVNRQSKVITTPITFAASANCVRYCGGDVLFADIDSESVLLNIQHVKEILEKAPRGTFDGLIPVDFAGRAVNMELFRELADEHNLWIIEDACHAPGGFFTDSNGRQQFCGNGVYADLAIFSFHPVKHIAAGEGGMITTNDEKLYEKLLTLRTHGITRNEAAFTNPVETAIGSQNSTIGTPDYPNWYMEMHELGYNYRLTDFQAALGASQLLRADEGVARRIKIAETYAEAFRGKDYIKNDPEVVEGHAYHLYVLEVENRLELYNELRQKGVYAQIHYIPLHIMPYYRQFGWKEGDFPNAERYYSRCISLPMYPALTEEQQQYVIECIYRFYEK